MFKASRVLLLVAGSTMCLAAAAAAENDASGKSATSGTPAPASEPKKVSPYAEANKRNIDPATGRNQHTMKRAASGRVQASPVRRKH